MTLHRWLLATIASLGLLAAGVVAAADSTDWAVLTPAQKTVLAPLSRDWGGIEAPRRAKWLEVAAKFPSMPKEEQVRVQARMADWARMTPTERSRARLQFQEVKQVPASERQAKWEAYQALPEDQKHALAQTAKPCAMCAGLIVNARLGRVVFGAGARRQVPAHRTCRSGGQTQPGAGFHAFSFPSRDAYRSASQTWRHHHDHDFEAPGAGASAGRLAQDRGHFGLR